jgi:hypothetical protein
MYPPALKSPYGERRSSFGKERYSVLGIARADWEARQRAAIANWDCFGAPAARFCYIDRDLGVPQWADLGMYLQTVMLLLRAEGLHSCPQMAWSQVRTTVAEIATPPAELILYCGMSIGHEDVIDSRVSGRRRPTRPGPRISTPYPRSFSSEGAEEPVRSRPTVPAVLSSVILPARSIEAIGGTAATPARGRGPRRPRRSRRGRRPRRSTARTAFGCPAM